MKEPKMSRGLFIAVVVIVGVGLVGLGVFAAYSLLTPKDVVPTPASNPPVTIDTPEPSVPTPADSGLTDKDIDDSLLFGEPIDQDGDGLDDVREGGIQTDPKNWDSDGDGLSDGDEVIIWKTDPLNPDTDADGYTDGMEVKSGYSPTGSGRLFEPPVETK